MAHTIAQQHRCYAIDADYNMDLSYNLDYTYNNKTPTFHKNHDKFRTYVWLAEDKNRSKIIKNHKKTLFQLGEDVDTFTQWLQIAIDTNLYLMLSWLGDEHLFMTDRCGHGHIAPLKYYLSLLDTKEDYLIADTSAGADMFHCGLYNSFDMIYIVCEPSQNSIRVTKQIMTLCKNLHIPYAIIINKRSPETNIDIPVDKIAGRIPNNKKITEHSYEDIGSDIQKSAQDILRHIQKQKKQNTINTLRFFYTQKQQ